MFFIFFFIGELLFEIPSLIFQIYIEKTIIKKHLKYARSKIIFVRRYCAFYGYHLDLLQFDKNWKVRLEVVRKKYNLEKFILDKNKLVRNEAKNLINKKE